MRWIISVAVTTVILTSTATFPVFAQTLPFCLSVNSDTDGDGYGWENNRSCRVKNSDDNDACEDRGDFPWGWNPITRESCLLGVQTRPSACEDPDGDGYGWNGIATCIVDSAQCNDYGTYPWGWNPVTRTSCRLDEQSQCSDSDGDGVAALTPLRNHDSGSDSLAYNNIVYFVASTADTGSEVNAYDPATGTVTVIGDIFEGSTSSLPGHLTILNDKLYITARDPFTQRDLWVYDPETSEPPIALNLFSNDQLEGHTLQGNLIAFADKLYFTADEFGVGNELGVYDPQTGVATLVADINPGLSDSDPRSLISVLGKLYFSADDGINGRELWVYDPVSQTTSMVADLSTSPGGSDPGQLYAIDNKIYYNTQSGGQTRVYDPAVDNRPALIQHVFNGQQKNAIIMGAVNGRLLLRIDEFPSSVQPWQYDPVTDTTSVIANMIPEEFEPVFYPGSITALGDTLYYRLSDPRTNESELWEYNTLTMQSRRFFESPRPDLEFPVNIAAHDNKLLFVAGSIAGPRDRKWWVYDPDCK